MVIAEENIASGRVLRLEQWWMPPVRNLSLALLTGGLMALAFPGWEAWILGWVALAPLLVAIPRERRPLRAFGLGLVSGTLFFYAACWWIAYPPVHYADFPRPLAYALALIPCAISGLYVGLFALVVHVAVRRLSPHTMLAAPLVWVACEWLRLKTMGVGWNMLGYSQAFQPALVQGASLGGVYAVSFLLVASSAALAYGLIAPSRRAARAAMLATFALIIANVWYGVAMLSRTQAAAEGLAVIAVQPNLPIAAPSEDEFDVAIGRLTRLGRDELDRANAPPMPSPTLLVWPEIPVPILYEKDSPGNSFLASMATHRGDYLLFNAIGRSGAADTNAAVLIGPDGRHADAYDKIRLLPFGEYVPMRSIIPFLDKVPALAGEFTPGDRVHLLDVGGARLSISICFESSFPDLAREARAAGASGFVNLTNDAWFGPTPEPRQHLAHAVMRSVENRTEQVRVTNAGYSARIDAAGRIVDSTDLFREATRRWVLPREPWGGETLYTRAGDWLAVASALATLGLVVAALARRQPPVIELE
jgi:apolipoprotein N-acyltransferase